MGSLIPRDRYDTVRQLALESDAVLGGFLRGQMLVRLVLDGPRIVREERLLEGQVGRIRDVRNGPDGFLYLLTDDVRGRVVRVEPAAGV